MIEDILAIATIAFLFIGGAFTLVGSIGLLKLRTPMARLHAPTKASTLLLASMIDSYLRGEPSLHELLIMAFLFVTAPISAHFIAKVHIHRKDNKDELPRPEPDKVWATLDNRDDQA